MLRKLYVGLVALLALGLGLSSAAMAATSAVCNTESVSGLGGFNTQATCPSGTTATGGGYQLTSAATGDLLGVSVNESQPVFSNITPTGWQVIGTNLTTIPGKMRVCVLCTMRTP
jgi:hypothetical protein